MKLKGNVIKLLETNELTTLACGLQQSGQRSWFWAKPELWAVNNYSLEAVMSCFLKSLLQLPWCLKNIRPHWVPSMFVQAYLSTAPFSFLGEPALVGGREDDPLCLRRNLGHVTWSSVSLHPHRKTLPLPHSHSLKGSPCPQTKAGKEKRAGKWCHDISKVKLLSSIQLTNVLDDIYSPKN